MADRARLRDRIGLFLGPLSVFIAALMLFLGRGYFDHGPGVPTAGRTEAWNLIWLAMLMVVVGHVGSSLWLAVRLVARTRSRGGWLVWSAAYHALAIPLAIWIWLA